MRINIRQLLLPWRHFTVKTCLLFLICLRHCLSVNHTGTLDCCVFCWQNPTTATIPCFTRCCPLPARYSITSMVAAPVAAVPKIWAARRLNVPRATATRHIIRWLHLVSDTRRHRTWCTLRSLLMRENWKRPRTCHGAAAVRMTHSAPTCTAANRATTAPPGRRRGSLGLATVAAVVLRRRWCRHHRRTRTTSAPTPINCTSSQTPLRNSSV